jgi:phosphate starvation-inducible PhoH-like protein
VLRDIDDIGICELTGADVVRHQLVQKIIEAYEKYEGPVSGTGKKPSGGKKKT